MTFTLQVVLSPEDKEYPGMTGKFGVAQGQRRREGPSIVMIQNPVIEPY